MVRTRSDSDHVCQACRLHGSGLNRCRIAVSKLTAAIATPAPNGAVALECNAEPLARRYGHHVGETEHLNSDEAVGGGPVT